LTAILLGLAACRSSPPIRLGGVITVADRGGTDPTIAIDSVTGTTYVAWTAIASDSVRDVHFARAAKGQSFGPAKAINPSPGEVASSKEYPPQVVVAGRDTLYVGWIGSARVEGRTMKTRVLRVARSVDGGATFDPPVSLGEDAMRGPATFAYFDLAATPGGTVVATWLDLGRYVSMLTERQAKGIKVDPRSDENRGWAEQTDLRMARSTDAGRTFATLPVVDSITCICCRTSVAAAPSGTAYLMWRHVFPGDIRDFVVAKATPQGIASPTRVHEDNWELKGCPDIGPDIAADGHGRVHVAWYTGAPGLQGLHYARSTDDGATFGPPVDILTGPNVMTSEVKLALSGRTPWLVWEDKRELPITLRLAWVGETGTLGDGAALVGNGRSPAIAAARGRLGLAWTDQGKILVRLGEVASGAPSGS
jgi:hypothetical protein